MPKKLPKGFTPFGKKGPKPTPPSAEKREKPGKKMSAAEKRLQGKRF